MTTQTETAPHGAAAGPSHWFVAVVAVKLIGVDVYDRETSFNPFSLGG